ncbi:hypothetical protein C5167_001651 [Papaver somniferum]|uniref:Uncharacterized protein n=1 Tax=Papaver somniferum TaxID=3469 RepID=A0A4Y7KXH4_PAPSO|nr:hypothetical protein C5167_001651 [Papaver somniferum]
MVHAGKLMSGLVEYVVEPESCKRRSTKKLEELSLWPELGGYEATKDCRKLAVKALVVDVAQVAVCY